MMRLADYVFKTLADRGVRHVFVVTGGGAMHLNDAIGREARLSYVCLHHEQAAAMAAEGYARVTGTPGVINVTTGPGGINSLNGVFGAWTDSIPMLILSGQVKRETMLATHGLVGRLRQLGDQEVDIVGMVRGITKSAVTVTDPGTIRYELERALHLTVSGRPGPVWLDIPVDVQGTQIEPEELAGYDPATEPPDSDPAVVVEQCSALAERLRTARRPVVLPGTGVYSAAARAAFEKLIRRLGAPVATAWTAVDLLGSDDPLFVGRPGSVGDRAGNFAVQNADLVLTIGCRLAIRQVSYNWPAFARHAYKVQVDIDRAELEKPMVRPDLAVHADSGFFCETLVQALDQAGAGAAPYEEWTAWCRERVRRYPVVLPRHRRTDRPINPYDFAEVLFDRLGDDDVVACGNATACVVPFQAARIRRGQRVFTNGGSASMGYDLPAAIGAAFARGGGRVVCLAGDGSIMMNLQELQTVAHHRLNLKLFVLNNGGYLSIRSTQQAFFRQLLGEGPATGVSFPDFVAVAAAFGLPATRLENPGFAEPLTHLLAQPGPMLIDVILDGEQPFEPKLSSRQLADGRMVSSSLEDMAPFLDREELRSNLLYEEDATSV